MSQSIRDKNGRFVKGTFPIKPFLGIERLGKKNSEYQKSKARLTWLGKKFSKEHKDKLRKAKIGKKLTEEHKKKISNSNKGKKHLEETRKKISLGHKGKNSYLWKGGITSLRGQIYNSFKYRQWRSDVFTRDDFTCQWCRKRGNKIAADHYLKSFAQILEEYKIKTLEQALECEELWNINNGRTLCYGCHYKTDNYGYKGRIKQLNNYPWCKREYWNKND